MKSQEDLTAHEEARIWPTAQEAAGATQSGSDASFSVSGASVVPDESSSVGCYACQRRGCASQVPRRREHGAFCSDVCRVWAYRHSEDDLRRSRPVIVERHRGNVARAREDHSKPTAQLRAAILAVLADGQEHEIGDFTRASGATWAAISPRLRELRWPKYGSHNIPWGRLVRVGADGVKHYAYRLETGA